MIPLFVVDSKDRLMICAGCGVRGKKLDKLLEKVWNGIKKREKNNSRGRREREKDTPHSITKFDCIIYLRRRRINQRPARMVLNKFYFKEANERSKENSSFFFPKRCKK